MWIHKELLKDLSTNKTEFTEISLPQSVTSMFSPCTLHTISPKTYLAYLAIIWFLSIWTRYNSLSFKLPSGRLDSALKFSLVLVLCSRAEHQKKSEQDAIPTKFTEIQNVCLLWFQDPTDYKWPKAKTKKNHKEIHQTKILFGSWFLRQFKIEKKGWASKLNYSFEQ